MVDKRLGILKDVIIHPTVAFREISSNGQNYFLVSIIVLIVTSIALSLEPTDSIGKLSNSLTKYQILSSSFFLTPIFIGAVFLETILLCYLGRAFKGRANFKGLFSAEIYAGIIPSIISIPITALTISPYGLSASMAFSIWGIILSFIAYREAHQFSTKRALATIVLPVVILAAIGVCVVLFAIHTTPHSLNRI